MEKSQKVEGGDKKRAINLVQRCAVERLKQKNEIAIKAATQVHMLLNSIIKNKNLDEWDNDLELPESIILVGNSIPTEKYPGERTLLSGEVYMPKTPRDLLDSLEIFLRDRIFKEMKNSVEYKKAKAKKEIINALNIFGFDSSQFSFQVRVAKLQSLFSEAEIHSWAEVQPFMYKPPTNPLPVKPTSVFRRA